MKTKKYYRYKIIYLSLQEQLKKAGYKGKFDLSSLIEACGEELKGLTRHKDEGFNAVQWLATPKYLGIIKSRFGSTPEEAVANLYIELNKK